MLDHVPDKAPIELDENEQRICASVFDLTLGQEGKTAVEIATMIGMGGNVRNVEFTLEKMVVFGTHEKSNDKYRLSVGNAW
jgi:hypothetical protein